MSVTTNHTTFCDGQRPSEGPPSLTVLGDPKQCHGWADAEVQLSIRQVRQVLAKQGWVRRRALDDGYIDLCPWCAGGDA
ncbi:hypothetical protein ACTHQY_19290 [Rhodococcoides corynebacterioides]|uniref:hypothetical protein n=1 Tax=Rhodococcoides corynebacterioides TaxID=53972 RepID=UPI003F816CAA